MCPICIATAAVIAGKSASTGGMAVLVIKKAISKIQSKGETPWLPAKRN